MAKKNGNFPYFSGAVYSLVQLFLFGMILRLLSSFYVGLLHFSDFWAGTLKPFWYGWHFDLAMAGVMLFLIFGVSTVFAFSRRSFRFWGFVLIFCYCASMTADALYMQESGRHITYEVFNLLSIQAILGNLLRLYSVHLALCFITALVFTHWILPDGWEPHIGLIGRIPRFLFVLAVGVVCGRGFENIPQDPAWAYRAGGGAPGALIAMNGTYGMTWALTKGRSQIRETVSVPDGIPTKEIFQQWKNRRGIQNPISDFDGNIVVILLEGWPGIYQDLKIKDINNQEQEVLPFFNKLKKDSLSVDLMLAGGHRTTEGMFATLCSDVNPLGKGIMFSELENKNFTCLPSLLAAKGYSSAFFQGSDALTSGVGNLAQKIGFKDSYGKIEMSDSYKKEFNVWGVYDKELYQFTLDKMKDMPEPMLIGINTNTTHDLHLPKSEKFIFGDQDINTQHLSVVHFADHEFEDFYKKLQSRKWKKDWLLVLVADHTSYVSGGFFEQYSLPFLMKLHKVEQHKNFSAQEVLLKHTNVDGAFGQMDIGATLADFTGVKAPEFLGRSLLHPKDFSPGASVFHLGLVAWYEGPWAMSFNIRKFGEKDCFKWDTDRALKNPVPCPADSQEMYLRAVSFITESQNLLFK
jgi:hypothetical protein